MGYPIRVRAGALMIQNESVLLVKFEDHKGIHYNLPGGGVEAGESVGEAAVREAKEEAGIDVGVDSLAFIYEYAPHQNENLYGPVHNLSLFFACTILGNHEPSLPDNPDPKQTGVEWISLSELHSITLYPKIQDQIIEYTSGRYSLDLIQETDLAKY
ncbi:NUDIX domain-containing protein [Bacillus sp. AK031]